MKREDWEMLIELSLDHRDTAGKPRKVTYASMQLLKQEI